MFIAFINDLDESTLSGVKKFADDTKLYSQVSTLEDATTIQADLDSVFNWSKEWQMLFNVDKCKVMHIGHGNNFENSLNCKKLQVVNSEKDLGVFIETSLKPYKQCATAARNGNWILGMIKRNFNNLNQEIVLRLYKQVVRPHLEYAI